MAAIGPEISVAILAGGLGTRLRPALPDCPKVLAPVRGRPFLTYLLDWLAEAGAGEVTLLTGYAADQMQGTLGDTYAGLHLAYSVEPKPLGTAGALRWALPRLSGSTLLLLNGDSFCEVDVAAFQHFHGRKAAAISLVLARVPDASRFGRVEVSQDGCILCFEEKPAQASGWVNAGIYLLDHRVIEGIPPGKPLSLERDLLPALVASARAHGFPTPGRLLDIGTPGSYAEAERFVTTFQCPA